MKRAKTFGWIIGIAAVLLAAGVLALESVGTKLAQPMMEADKAAPPEREASAPQPATSSAAASSAAPAPGAKTGAAPTRPAGKVDQIPERFADTMPPAAAAQDHARAKAEKQEHAAMEQLLSQDGASAGASQFEDRTVGAASGLGSGGAMADLIAPQETGGPGSAFDGAPSPNDRMPVPKLVDRPSTKPIGGLIGAGPQAATPIGGLIGAVPPQKEIALPEFPWPPPAPSEKMDLPRAKFAAALGAKPTLGEVGSLLDDALAEADYSEYAYFHAPGGFALVARMEQIQADGTPVKGHRFLPPNSDKISFSISSYVAQLFVAPEGLYRLIVFVISDQPFVASAPAPSVATADKWLTQGADQLPSVYDSMPFTPSHRVSALVYEFRKAGKTNATPLSPGLLDARTHLVKAGLYARLTGGR